MAAAAESLAQLPPELGGWERRHLASRLELERSVGQITDRAPAASDGREFKHAWPHQPGDARAGSLRWWDLHSGEPLALWKGTSHWVRDVQPLPDGERLAVSLSKDRLTNEDPEDILMIADLDTGRAVDRIEGAVGGDLEWSEATGLLAVIDTASWTRITSLRGHDDYIYRVAVSPDGQRVITASGDGTVSLWDSVPDPQLLAARREHRRLVAQLEPRVLALLDDQQLEPKAAARQLKADASLGEREREVALQLLLRESVARDPDPLGERLRRRGRGRLDGPRHAPSS